MSATLRENAESFESGYYLIQEMNRIAAGHIAEPIKPENYSGIWTELASSAEAIRQMVFNFYCELQATDAQVSSSKEQIGETVKLIDGLADAFQGLKNDAVQVEANIKGLNETLEHGQKSLDKTGQVIQFLQQSSDEANQIMHDANDKLDALLPVINQTDGILAQIDKINNQIKILSFNAAIEAARAGSHGRGFTVVAQEMKKLSEQSYDSVKKTGRITGQIKGEIKQLVGTMSGSQKELGTVFARIYGEVEEGLQAQQRTFGEIIGDITSSKEKMERYTGQLTQQFSLWINALDSLKSSSQLFEKIEAALAASLTRVSQTIANLEGLSDESMNRMLLQLQELALEKALRNLAPSSHQAALLSFLRQQKGSVEAIYTTNREGAFIFSEPAAALANARVRPWWKEAMAGRVYKSPVYISAITRKPCLTLALPITGETGEPFGVLGVDLIVEQ